MKKQLLTMLVAVGALLTASAGSFTIKFKSASGSDSSTSFTSSNFVSNGVESGKEYINGCSLAENVYAGASGFGLKMASSKKDGKVTLKLRESAQFNATSIVIKATRYNDKGVDFTVNGNTVALSENTKVLEDYTVELDGSILENISLVCPSGKQIYVSEITVNYPDPVVVPAAPILDEYVQSGQTLTVTDGSFNVSVEDGVALWYRPDYGTTVNPEEPVTPAPVDPVDPNQPAEAAQAEGEAPALTPADINEANGWILADGSGPVRTIKIATSVVGIELVCVNDQAVSPVVNVSIKHHNSTTGIAATTINTNAPVEYYTIAGIRVANPTPGLYIRRQSTNVEKIVIR